MCRVICLEHETLAILLHRVLSKLTDYLQDVDVLQDLGGGGQVALCPDARLGRGTIRRAGFSSVYPFTPFASVRSEITPGAHAGI